MVDIIDIQNLSKQFAGIRAVDDLSFSVQKREVYGFLGQNGAGKSTTIRMVLTLIKPTSGSITVFGKNILTNRREILQKIGAIIEKPDLYKYLTALQNLKIVSKLSGVHCTQKQLMKQLEKVGIAERANSKVKSFSQGMKQRLGIACALIHNPELIILDEPTNGLDPQGIADVRNLILQLSKEEGKTIFVSSHLLSEIELIADSMLIIDKGRKVAQGKVADLLNPANTLVEIDTTDKEATRNILQQTQWHVVQPSDKIVLKMHRKDIPHLAKFLIEKDINIIAIQPKHSLEDYFLSLTTANQHVATYKN
jgi:ABC-type multidrug transport system ATPase subunit